MNIRSLKSVLGAQHRVFAGLCVVSVLVVLCALCLLPGAPIVPSLLAFVVLSLCAMVVYRRTAAYSPVGMFVLLFAATILALGVAANVYCFTTFAGGTDSAPVLNNPDASRAWNDAVSRLDLGGKADHPVHGLYGLVLSWIFQLTGPSITAGLMLSMAFTLCTLVLTPNIAVRLGMSFRAANCAMIATAAVCYLLASGMILVKDAAVICAISFLGLSVARRRLSLMCLIPAVVILLFCRINYLLYIPLALAVTYFGYTQRERRELVLRLGVCLAVLLLWKMPDISSHASHIEDMANIPANDTWTHPQQFAYFNIVGDFYSFPLWRKVLLLPFAAVVQFFIPFPWNFGRDIVFGFSQVYAHIAYPWYIFGGIFVYWLVFRAKRSPRALIAFALMAVLLWLAPCGFSGGTISRYALPAVPLLAPAVGYVLSEVNLRKGSFLYWILAWCVAVCVTLVVCYHLQTSAAALAPAVEISSNLML